MKDVQGSRDHRGITLQKAGVKDIYLPLEIRVPDGSYQPVLARVSLSADLSHECRGTHMSRFVEELYGWSRRKLSSIEVKEILEAVRKSLGARRAEIELDFRYFIAKSTPVSEAMSLLDYECQFSGVLMEEEFLFRLGVKIPLHILCPCSREISHFGAHNQRAVLKVRVHYPESAFIWIEELVSGLEPLGSAAIFPLLKRADEKYVTEQAYENPKFVEDVVRDAVLLLRSDSRIDWFEVECESAESIHNHSAFAYHSESR
ncbi:MAG: GTP cyclohydrolase FolE2 [Candidatus Eremiobacteraeota bacterium]|nr:GTP cyclohydrolase FolE2 [Candidatus Eremiobacteraeota bacterium]